MHIHSSNPVIYAPISNQFLPYILAEYFLFALERQI